MTKKNIDLILSAWKELKSEIESLSKIGKMSLKELQERVDQFISQAEKDLKRVVDKDLQVLLKKINKERIGLEKLFEKTVHQEIEKAKKFLTAKKKDLSKLQSYIEKSILNTKKNSAKKSTTIKKKTKKKASSPTKKATKKVVKKTTTASKKVTKKKTAKKKTNR